MTERIILVSPDSGIVYEDDSCTGNSSAIKGRWVIAVRDAFSTKTDRDSMWLSRRACDTTPLDSSDIRRRVLSSHASYYEEEDYQAIVAGALSCGVTERQFVIPEYSDAKGLHFKLVAGEAICIEADTVPAADGIGLTIDPNAHITGYSSLIAFDIFAGAVFAESVRRALEQRDDAEIEQRIPR